MSAERRLVLMPTPRRPCVSDRASPSHLSLGRVAAAFVWAVMLLSPAVKAAYEGVGSSSAQRIDIPVEHPRGAKRSITLEDILSMRQVSEPVLSPNATKVAYLITQAFLSCNCTRTALYVGSAFEARDVHKIDEEAQISSVRWAPDGRHVSFLSDRGGNVQLWWIDPAGGVPEQVFTHRASAEASAYPNPIDGPISPAGVLSYEWSPDGQLIAFTAVKPVDAMMLRRAEAEGFRYDERRMTVMDLEAGQWLRSQRSPQLWFYDMRTHRERLIWQSPAGTEALINVLAWSPEGKRLALSYGGNLMNTPAAVVDVASGRLTEVLDPGGMIHAIAWAPDGRSLATLNEFVDSGDMSLRVVQLEGKISREIARLYGTRNQLLWIGNNFYIASRSGGMRHENAGLYEMRRGGGSMRRLTSLADKVADCSRPVGYRLACVWQSPTEPPQPAVVDLETRSVVRLADVNPEVGGLRLGPVEQLHWANDFGEVTNGYLVRPPGAAMTGGRLPLVIVGYGFDGDFVAQANWTLTSYPAQAFARDGFAVLLINAPYITFWPGNDFRRSAHAFAYSPLSSLKTIIELLSREGVVDPGRVGFMGHSWGGFWVQFAIAHSDLLQVAELHNGGTAVEPGSYSGDSVIREMQDHLMGGGPYPPTLRNYLGFSATLTADRVRVPVLLEYDPVEAVQTIDYYTALKAHHVPAELIVYPDDGHSFTIPSHRLASMQRNLDWFEFWLLGKVRTDPRAADQYALWMKMREELRASEVNTLRRR